MEIQEIRQRKLRLSKQVLDSEEWKFLVSEIRERIERKEKEIDSLQGKGIIYESQYQAGYKKCLLDILDLPETIYRTNLSFFDKAKEKANSVRLGTLEIMRGFVDELKR